MTSVLEQAIDAAWPDSIRRGDGKPFVRPAVVGGGTITNTTGYYWENLDGDRFYFTDRTACAEDLAVDISLDETEAHEILK